MLFSGSTPLSSIIWVFFCNYSVFGSPLECCVVPFFFYVMLAGGGASAVVKKEDGQDETPQYCVDLDR